MSKPIVIGFATTNPHKLQETAACLKAMNPEIEVVAVPPLQDVEETGKTFVENARIKLHACLSQPLDARITHIIAEDAGLIVEAFDGLYGLSPFPGIRSDRWLTPDVQHELLRETFDNPTYTEKNLGILCLLAGEPDRNAAYVAVVSCWVKATGEIFDVEGRVNLSVAEEPKGDNGFGYDPIMIPREYDSTRTMAELSTEEKNTISHRYQALKQLLQRVEFESSKGTLSP